MAAPLDLRELERRPTKYWNEDGLPELVMGLLWVLWGGAWLVGNALPRGPVWNVFWMFTPALLALSGVAAVRLTKVGAGWEARNWMLVALGAAAAIMGAARFRMFVARNPPETRE